MATYVERDVHHVHDAGSDSSSAAMIVTIVALVVLAGFALFFFRVFPFNSIGTTPTDNGASINIDADFPTGTPTPDSTGN